MADEAKPSTEKTPEPVPEPTGEVNLMTATEKAAAAGGPVPPAPPADVPPVAQPAGEPGKIRGIGQLFKDSWAIFTQAWLKYIIFSLLILAIFVGAILVAAVIAIGGIALWQQAWVVSVILLIIGLLAGLYLILSLGLATSKFLYGFASGTPEGMKSSLGYGFKNSLSYFWVSLLTGLIVISAPLIVGIIFGVLVAVSGLNTGTIILGIVLIIPAIIAAIYLGTMLSFVTQNFVIEGNRGIGAIKRSWGLVKGSFWGVFGRFIVLGLVSIAISLLNQGFDNAVFALLTIISFVLNFIYSLVSVFYNFFIYKDLAGKK